MREPEFGSMEDRELTALVGGLPPPEELVREITPWRKAMDRVIAGLALTTVTLNFLCLDFLLPLIGAVMLVLGFRALRRENRGFMACLVLSVLRLVLRLVLLVLNAAVLGQTVLEHPAMRGLCLLEPAGTALTILCLWAGLRAVQRKAGLPPRASGALWLLVWYGGVVLLALAGYSGLLMGIAMVACYVLILRSLSRLSAALDEAGYAVCPVPPRVSDSAVKWAVTALLALGLLTGYLFLNQYPMDWREEPETAPSAQVRETRDRLLDLGFPQYVLDDLAEEEILACSGALELVWDSRDLPVNPGRRVTERTGSATHVTTVYDVRELRITGVAVRLPGEQERWKIIHHFLWVADPGFRGTESIQFWPASRLEEGWTEEGAWSGRLLYDRDGVTYTAPYYRLGPETFRTQDLFFGGERVSTDVFAAFSLPRRGENCRGYVSYEIRALNDGSIVDSWFNYTYQNSRFQYPVRTAMEQRMLGGFNSDGAFTTVQYALQFFPNDRPLATFRQQLGPDQ